MLTEGGMGVLTEGGIGVLTEEWVSMLNGVWVDMTAKETKMLIGESECVLLVESVGVVDRCFACW